MSTQFTVIEVPRDRIMDLRVRVLRKGTPVTHCEYPEDDLADVVHLAIVDHDKLIKVVATTSSVANHDVVATSTWFMRACPQAPDRPAMQLKGMAVDEDQQGRGLGAALVAEGLNLARSRGAEIVWARARDSALGFYQSLGFAVVGDGFIDEPTAMPHHIVIIDI